jgi:Gpi18-like mannosyltransferase
LLGGQSLLAALLVTNISALIFFWYLYRLVEADYGEKIAKRAVILSAVFPTSFYLFMGYTEAPLMAFTVAAFYYGRQGKWWLAGILAGCAALIKQPGIFLLIPLAYMYWKQYITYKDKRKRFSFFRKLEWAWLLLIPITALGYMAYRYLFLSTPSSGATDLGANESITFPGQYWQCDRPIPSSLV